MRDDLSARPPLELDASLAAHRQLLILMFTLLARDAASREELIETIHQRLIFHDGHEDPGLEADMAVAFERRMSDELRRILGDVLAALETAGRDAKTSSDPGAE